MGTQNIATFHPHRPPRIVFLCSGQYNQFKTQETTVLRLSSNYRQSTRGLTAEQQKELLLTAIEELQTIGDRVIALVMDGLSTNMTMCSLLGCQMNVTKCLQPWYYNIKNFRKLLEASKMHDENTKRKMICQQLY